MSLNPADLTTKLKEALAKEFGTLPDGGDARLEKVCSAISTTLIAYIKANAEVDLALGKTGLLDDKKKPIITPAQGGPL